MIRTPTGTFALYTCNLMCFSTRTGRYTLEQKTETPEQKVAAIEFILKTHAGKRLVWHLNGAMPQRKGVRHGAIVYLLNMWRYYSVGSLPGERCSGFGPMVI